jgi:hypothetical protein
MSKLKLNRFVSPLRICKVIEAVLNDKEVRGVIFLKLVNS